MTGQFENRNSKGKGHHTSTQTINTPLMPPTPLKLTPYLSIYTPSRPSLDLLPLKAAPLTICTSLMPTLDLAPTPLGLTP